MMNEKELTQESMSEFKRLKEWVSKCPVEAAMKIQELQELLSTHEPHGRNYTNEQHVKLREQVQELDRKGHKLANKFINLQLQNKRYRGVIKFAVKHLENSNIRQIEMVVYALNESLGESK